MYGWYRLIRSIAGGAVVIIIGVALIGIWLRACEQGI